ncbi:hypothetical protein CYPRO_0640 [Cyclonatronum proteinivorum]|uniref:Uncharacterized protein n=1 Tax=Cyclonatronum proteinivorum TaxID=1457365 RepID=A0A345UHH3_9BACT|nr:hypothetical protein [Cyclonatronum proteinivorum]AXI99924.1 hypothetical protein CYPRO_0640 [Cyclonatronum proteinivorum]
MKPNPAPVPPRPEDDHFMTEVMRKSETSMPFPDFEDDVMRAVAALEAEAHAPQTVAAGGQSSADVTAELADVTAELRRMRVASVRLSWFFFLIGLAAGIALLLMTPSYNIGFLGFEGREAWMLIQGTCLIWLLMQTERLVLLTKEYIDRYGTADAGPENRPRV